MNRIVKWGLIALGAVAVVAAGGAYAAFEVPAVQDAVVDRLRTLLEETGNRRLAKIMNDTQSYHTSPVEAATLLKDANVKQLIFYHFTPAVPNVIAERILTRGVSEVRPHDWLVARDGTMVELPAGSAQVRIGDIAAN